eukprot:TRINITY_DN6349_c0_g1_i2.p1 TRINITY_DN6349_c0_g1~~TRINITY_DN6349_c0_g1_i2.p1  ORF type:complete len:194 (+),score=25.97 TRINITY_DN6349_c0_g1_i2:220-801(+)
MESLAFTNRASNTITFMLSDSIKCLTNSPYSHCGIVIKMPDPKSSSKEEEFFLVEADIGDGKGDHMEKGKSIYGILINKFEDRIRAYHGSILWHASLRNELSAEKKSLLVGLIMELKQKKVQYDLTDGIQMVTGMDQKEDGSSLYCSELIAHVYQKIGVLPESVNSSTMGPWHLAQLDVINGKYPSVIRYRIN